MKKSDFYFELPEELIAQHPAQKRDMSRLLCLGRKSGQIEHKHFYDVIDYLKPGDCLVLNNTKVLPARLYGIKKTGAKVEFLMLKNLGDDRWEVITGPGRKAREGDEFDFGDGILHAIVEKVLDNGNRIAHFTYAGSNIYEVLDKIGEMPLPHYIKEKLTDNDRYQTVYAKDPGSAAAPTAGLHFTQELLEKIKEKGVDIAYVTLHVGIGTFRPVKTENIEEHKMHTEHYYIDAENAEKINKAKLNGNRVIAVGTTSCRTLESASSPTDGTVKECVGDTSIFIYPGYKFKCIDGLITNFHLPESTLIMLVSAFCGRENTLNAYKVAVENKYRFFSFGDAMLIM
ncbi:MAG: tRNA preQ1(34) S-adenosylmethionine ribosyltransferase-isomerase QueA [Oscillospiraceae bacterium]|nr:tRNA preQ1(34) S-adenosylmethionine ribosyltransferase-isomerase QueA [Oscillospiraceae bacterium]MDY3938438.1 tRNA preQ1(34) S-adenosylmethionine ribosyltransferase-isomerase QueA [Oscillospiraceae bacterium]